MNKKVPVGRPPVKDKRIPVTFMALESKVEEATKKAKKKGADIRRELEQMLYDYISR